MSELKIQEHVPLAPLHTFACQTQAAAVVALSEEAQLADITRYYSQWSGPTWVIGSGSNLVFAADFPGTLILNRLKGRACIEENKAEGTGIWRVAAGELWHDWVSESIADGWCGLENLALIPGTVGAAPVQNIGAYGVELSSVCVGLSAWHLPSGKMQTFSVSDCEFAYRDSFFKRPEQQNQWIITSVDFRLSQQFKPNVAYPALANSGHALDSAQSVFDAVCQIRQQKLPDPKVQPNAGSFFKNPIVSHSVAENLRQKLPNLPVYAVKSDPVNGADAEEQVKLSAAYLIEQAGLKGKNWEDVGVSAKHALVLVRHQSGDGQGVLSLSQHIQSCVADQFGITLAPEPILWPVCKTDDEYLT